MTLAATGPNARQIEYWNQTAGPKWVRFQEALDRHIEGFGVAAMEAAALRDGERVLDVGCGCGTTTLALAQRVGPSGTVLGVDISAPMLAHATARARATGVANVRFAEGDAQTHAFEGDRFDVVYSRFGVMFFADPPAAFANLRRALAPGGRLAFVCWQPITENDWMLVPTMAAAQHVTLELPSDPTAPGPFSLGDAAHLGDVLERGGFAAVRIEPLRTPVTIGGATGLDDAVAFMLQIGPAGAALNDADEATRAAVRRAVRAALAPFDGPDGVRMPAAAWIVTGRAPDQLP